MIEHRRVIDALPDIVRVPGLDAVLVGPYDLSASLGLTGLFALPEFEATIARILEVTKAAGMPCGVHVVTLLPQDLQRRREAGFRFIACGIDSVNPNQGARRPQ